VEGLALLLELGPFLGGAGGHHLDAVPQMVLPVRELEMLCLQLLPLPPDARFRLLHHPLGLDQEAGKRDLHGAREEVPPMYHLGLIPLHGLGAGAGSACV
jgi:hypothetical protein